MPPWGVQRIPKWRVGGGGRCVMGCTPDGCRRLTHVTSPGENLFTPNVLSMIAPSLPESELRYRRLFETARDGILIMDPSTRRIIDVNPFLIEFLGFTR